MKRKSAPIVKSAKKPPPRFNEFDDSMFSSIKSPTRAIFIRKSRVRIDNEYDKIAKTILMNNKWSIFKEERQKVIDKYIYIKKIHYSLKHVFLLFVINQYL